MPRHSMTDFYFSAIESLSQAHPEKLNSYYGSIGNIVDLLLQHLLGKTELLEKTKTALAIKSSITQHERVLLSILHSPNSITYFNQLCNLAFSLENDDDYEPDDDNQETIEYECGSLQYNNLTHLFKLAIAREKLAEIKVLLLHWEKIILSEYSAEQAKILMTAIESNNATMLRELSPHTAAKIISREQKGTSSSNTQEGAFTSSLKFIFNLFRNQAKSEINALPRTTPVLSITIPAPMAKLQIVASTSLLKSNPSTMYGSTQSTQSLLERPDPYKSAPSILQSTTPQLST